MKNQKRKTAGCHMAAITAAILTMSFPMNILAASNRPDDNTYQAPEAPAPNYNKDMSPEFAYTEEKWASLRDNVMEYGELKDLIHEYNPTVRSNRSAYKDQKGKISMISGIRQMRLRMMLPGRPCGFPQAFSPSRQTTITRMQIWKRSSMTSRRLLWYIRPSR